MFSKRTEWELKINRLTLILQRLQKNEVKILDLTQSNPTQCGFQYLSQEILSSLLDSANLQYHPSAKGLSAARETIAQYYGRKGISIHPEQVFLTSSTSEAYSFLLRLLCDSFDRVLVPRPSYPLFDYLLRLNDVVMDPYHLFYEGRWQIDMESIKSAIQPKTRGIVVVSPNNPTGSFLHEENLSLINQTAKESELFLICDEVFSDYAFSLDPTRVRSGALNQEILTFTLSGISKVLGLPQMKLGWIIVSGPRGFRKEAIARLEVIADTYLSVNAPAQNALFRWFSLAPTIQKEIHTRVLKNHEFLLKRCESEKGLKVLHSEGGWYGILHLPLLHNEEEFTLALLKEDHVLVHPGYFFDFESEGYIVLCLLPQEEIFEEAVDRFLRKYLTKETSQI